MPTPSIFVHAHSLPEPFDGMEKVAKGVASKFAEDGTDAKLDAGLMNALINICEMGKAVDHGGIGKVGSLTVAEYPVDASTFHLVSYNPDTGMTLAGIYNIDADSMETYKVGTSKLDAAAIFTAMFPAMLGEDEFKEKFEELSTLYDLGFEAEKAYTLLAILCDNVYRRMQDETSPFHLKSKVPNSGSVMVISHAKVVGGGLKPDTRMLGTFKVFDNGKGTKTKKASGASASSKGPVMALSDFKGRYAINPEREYTALEEMALAVLPETHVITAEEIFICEHVQKTTGTHAPVRTIAMRGMAGGGKTESCVAVAVGGHQRYRKQTLHADTELSDVTGYLFPCVTVVTGIEKIDEELKLLNDMGGVTFENVARMMDMPDGDDLVYMPEESYRLITGTVKEDATTQDCIQLRDELVMNKVKELHTAVSETGTKAPRYTYIETELVRGLRNGDVVEIQEANAPERAGALAGLNAVLEPGGSMVLPTGETLRRHPESVIIFTYNPEYNGMGEMNQALVDRCQLVLDIEMPPKKVVIERLRRKTGCKDDCMLDMVAEATIQADAYARQNSFDGVCGMRSATDCLNSYIHVTNNIYTSLNATLVAKSSSNALDRDELRSAVIDQIFPPTAA